MEGELASTALEFEFHLQFPYSPVAPSRLSCQISANKRECKQTEKTRAKGNDVITNVISANQHFALTFSMQIFRFQRGSSKLSFLFPPRRQLERPGELTRRLIRHRNRQLFESVLQSENFGLRYESGTAWTLNPDCIFFFR